jgi:hypothetical protein
MTSVKYGEAIREETMFRLRGFQERYTWIEPLRMFLLHAAGGWSGKPAALLHNVRNAETLTQKRYKLPPNAEALLAELVDSRGDLALLFDIDVTVSEDAKRVGVYDVCKETYFKMSNQINHLEHKIRDRNDAILRLREDNQEDRKRLKRLEACKREAWPHGFWD